MSLVLPLARRWLGLPGPLCSTEPSTQWVPLSDGTRPATRGVRPADPSARPVPSVLWRTARPLRLGVTSKAPNWALAMKQYSCFDESDYD